MRSHLVITRNASDDIENVQGVPDDFYGSTLLAVSEVVMTVREQTAQIRQARAAVPESSPVRWDPNQG